MNSALTPRPGKGLLIAALHLPDLSVRRHLSLAYLEDYALANAGALYEGGIDHIILQDQTRQRGPASPETIAIMAALGKLIKHAYSDLSLGIIVQAHDGTAPIAIAHAAGADFVRLKIFVGAAMTFEGHREALAVEAVTYRHYLRADHIAIFADVFDRTAIPTIDVSPERAALSAVHCGANALVITGSDFADSLSRIAAARGVGANCPILIGGGVTANNAAQALTVADGVIVSTSLMRHDFEDGEVIRWDINKTRAIVEATTTQR